MDRTSLLSQVTGNASFVPKLKLWFLPRPDIINMHSLKATNSSKKCTETEGIDSVNTTSGEVIEIEENEVIAVSVEIQHRLENTTRYSLCRKVVAAMTNPRNYLFALLHSCLCAPQAILGALWLKKYLMVKFQDCDIGMDGTKANMIACMTNIGAAISSLMFGFIGKRYQKQYPSTYRVLVMSGFILWSTALLMIYIPAQYHSEWILFVLSFTSGAGMGAITIVFAGVRKVNQEAKCADFASGLVSAICMGAMYVSYQVTGGIFKIVKDHPDETNCSVQEFNVVFYYVVAAIAVGFTAAIFVPKM